MPGFALSSSSYLTARQVSLSFQEPLYTQWGPKCRDVLRISNSYRLITRPKFLRTFKNVASSHFLSPSHSNLDLRLRLVFFITFGKQSLEPSLLLLRHPARACHAHSRGTDLPVLFSDTHYYPLFIPELDIRVLVASLGPSGPKIRFGSLGIDSFFFIIELGWSSPTVIPFYSPYLPDESSLIFHHFNIADAGPPGEILHKFVSHPLSFRSLPT